MNEQQLQQILTIQQAIAAAATAAVINSLLNPQQQQQAAGAGQPNALTDSSNDLQQQHQLLQQLQQLQQDSQRRDSPVATSPTIPADACNNRIQDLLAQLQQNASMNPAAGLAALNLNLGANQLPGQATGISNPGSLGSPISGSPVSRLSEISNSGPTTSNIHQSQASPIKKLKTRHNHHNSQPQQHLHLQQQSFHNRSSEATSKPQHSTPKNYSTHTISANMNSNSRNNSNASNQNTSSSSSSAFMANNVGLPRKLVRGQDVWLGRGAEQTRQILKCMWCGQSFRTLAEMTQHMKITQHYTNIISQEQITSWRQPESSEPNAKHGSNKQGGQIRGLEDIHDDHSSDKFNGSDRDDAFSNDDEPDHHQKHRPSSNQSINNRLDLSNKNDSANESSRSESPQRHTKSSAKSSTKPLTRSRRRENETRPSKRDAAGERIREHSPATSSSSQQGHNSSSNLILGELNENTTETNKEDDKTDARDSQELDRPASNTSFTKSNVENNDATIGEDDANDDIEADADRLSDKAEDHSIKRDPSGLKPTSQEQRLKDTIEKIDRGNVDEDDDGAGSRASPASDARCDPDTLAEHEADDMGKDIEATGEEEDNYNDDERDNNIDEQASETNESAATTTTTSVAISGANGGGQKTDTGDPLSALETMVEKSFDPRMRPGVANGGILQRLGIDEEVCPPWQQLNYSNWYAAAAYHPMAAAALLAAGLNLQNGIKLSKNVAPKKNDD